MTPTRPPAAGTPVRRWSRLFVAGVLAWLVALALVAPHLTSGTELVRLRHALALGPDLAVDADWQPPQWPVDYMQDGPTPAPYFVAIAEGLGLAAMPDDWTRGKAIARHLLGSPPALLGGAIQHDLRHTYEAIVQNRKETCPAGRFADPKECGDLIAYLCSAQAGFMSGQNIVNDGGVYQGLL